MGKIVDLASERLVDELNDAKKLSPALLNVIMGTAWDKLYAKTPADMDAPMNLMINLFGHGAGEKLAKSLGCAAMGQAAGGRPLLTDVEPRPWL